MKRSTMRRDNLAVRNEFIKEGSEMNDGRGVVYLEDEKKRQEGTSQERCGVNRKEGRRKARKRDRGLLGKEKENEL